MLNNTIKYFSFSLLLLLFGACSENTILDIDHNSALEVNGQILQGDRLMNITVSKSFGLRDTLFYDDLGLQNIEISMETPDKGTIIAFSDRLTNNLNGLALPIWEFDYSEFIPGEEYILSAEAEGLDRISATARVPEMPKIIDMVYTPSTSDATVVRDRFDLTFDDPGDEENYYYIKGFETIEESGFEYQSDFRFYSLPSNPIDESFLEEVITSFSDKDFNGSGHTIIFYGERIRRNQVGVEFQLFQISKDHHEFIQNYQKSNSDSPIAEPVIFNSNIRGGHGIFAISSKPDTYKI